VSRGARPPPQPFGPPGLSHGTPDPQPNTWETAVSESKIRNHRFGTEDRWTVRVEGRPHDTAFSLMAP